MRTNLTDNLGDEINTQFQKSRLSVKEFVDSVVADGAFDHHCDDTRVGFHTIQHGEIISYYFVAERNQWYAKI